MKVLLDCTPEELADIIFTAQSQYAKEVKKNILDRQQQEKKEFFELYRQLDSSDQRTIRESIAERLQKER